MTDPQSQPDCIFCKIANKQIPATILAETSECLAFLDAKPKAPGHTLIIPKTHYTNLLDLPPSLYAPLLEMSKQVAQQQLISQQAQAFNFAMNNNRAAGQLIPHAHFHIIPRKDSDALTTPHDTN